MRRECQGGRSRSKGRSKETQLRAATAADASGPLQIVASSDTYESSRLVVPAWLASFRSKGEGEPVGIIPSGLRS
jgi:hypothetical protein